MVEILTRYRDEIVAALERALAQDGPLARLLRYPLGLEEPDGTPGPGIGGKLLRPSLVCFSCEALGGDVSAALPLACALELVHNFSLVHDDIQDGDELRRGRPTVWKAFGAAQAINSGDGLLVLALKTAIEAQGALSPRAVLTALEVLSSATFRMIEGQALDLGLEGGDSGGVREYLAMARRKTGALFGAAFELGAIAADRPELGPENHELGETLGLAFQITDDILGIWGRPERTGKPARRDLVRRKHSWPVAYALEQDPALGELLSRSPVPVEKVLERLSALGVRRAAEEAARRYVQEARDKAEVLPWTQEAKGMFEELLSFLAKREV